MKTALEAAREALKKIGQSVPLNAQAVRAYDTALSAIDAALAESGETEKGYDIHALEQAFQAGRQSMSGTDRHRDHHAWETYRRRITARASSQPLPTPPSGDAS